MKRAAKRIFLNLGVILSISLTGLGLMGSSATAANFSGPVNLQGFYFSDAYKYSVIEDTLLQKHPGNYVITTSFSYINAPFVAATEDSNNKISNIIDRYLLLTGGYTYYLNRNLSLGADVAILDAAFADGDSVSSLADTVLRAKWRFWRNTKERMAMALIPRINLPTGDEDSFSTDDSIRFSVLAVLEKVWQRFSLNGGVGVSHASNAQYLDVDYRDLLLTQIGASYKMTQDWNLNFESVRNFTYKDGDEKQDAGDYYLTVKGAVAKTADFYGGAGWAGTSEIDEDNYTVFAGLKFHAPKKKKKPVVEEAPEPLPAPVSRDDESRFGKLERQDRVYFANSSSIIDAKARDTLNEVANFLLANDRRINKVVIEGYASKVGPRQFNQILSDARAKNVMVYLQEKGINADKLVTVAYGDDYLEEEPEHWQNRRVEFRIFVAE